MTFILIICLTISFISCMIRPSEIDQILEASKQDQLFIPDTMIDAKTILHKERKTGLTDAEVERMMGKPKNILDIDYEIDDGNNVYFEIEPTEPIQESKIRKSRVIKREGKNTFAMHEYSYIPQHIYMPNDSTKLKLIYRGKPVKALIVEDDMGIVRNIPIGVTTERV